MSNKICLAYIASNCLKDKGIDVIQKIDFKKLTHISIAFAKIKQIDGKRLPYITDETADLIPKIKEEISNQNANTKIILSVGGAFQDGFCQASRTAESRELFAENLHKIVDDLQIDGIDIDWEFPGDSSLGIESCKNCKDDYILLLKTLRNQFKNKLLTIAVGSNRFTDIDVKSIAENVDYVLVMTYDLGVTHSSMYLTKMFINLWQLHGIPKHKLCVGVPFYARNVRNLDETISYSEANTGNITHIAGQSFSDYIGKKWCFDTENDIKAKADWARKKNLAGIFCWEITTDVDNRLITAMHTFLT